MRFDTVCPDGLARTGSERTIDILRDRLLIRATLRLPQHVDGALYDPTTDRGLTVKNQLKPLHEAARPAGSLPARQLRVMRAPRQSVGILLTWAASMLTVARFGGGDQGSKRCK